MAFGETAKLVASIELQDKFSGPAKVAQESLGNLGDKSGLVSRGFGLISQGAAGIGGAFSHLKGRIGELITGPLGLLGLAGGIGGIVALFKGGIDKAKDFGAEVGALAKITGLSTEATSALAAAFDHFGIESDTARSIVGLAEKNLFKFGATTKENQAFIKKYGFSLQTATGQLKDFNTLLLDTSDFFLNKNIPAAQKAALLAAIYGKNWQALLPILSAGRQKISDAEEEAAALGLTLTKDNLATLTKLKEATRRWGDALGGLKLQLGLAVIPVITDLVTAATAFLTATDKFGRTGSQRIVQFFGDLVEFGRHAFEVIRDQVVPIVEKVIDNWNKLPPALKSLLVKGVTGNFAIKFLLGFSPTDLAGAAAAAVAGKLAGSIAGALGGMVTTFIGDIFGKTALQKLVPQVIEAVNPIPVLVVNPGFGLPTGPTGPFNPLDEAGKVGFWATILRFLPTAVSILGLTTLPGSGVQDTSILAQAIADAAHKPGATLADIEALGFPLAAVKEFVKNPKLTVDVEPKLLAALEALANQGKPNAPEVPHGHGPGINRPHDLSQLDPGIARWIKEHAVPLPDTAMTDLSNLGTVPFPVVLPFSQQTALLQAQNKVETAVSRIPVAVHGVEDGVIGVKNTIDRKNFSPTINVKTSTNLYVTGRSVQAIITQQQLKVGTGPQQFE